jgi:putative transcriptional regulator
MVQCQLEDILWHKKLRLADLARLTGINYTTLHRLAQGKSTGISFNTLSIICRVLQCTPSDLLKVTGSHESLGD